MALTSLTNLQPLHVHSVGVSTFDGSVSVGGTLTYEDVTNVDAIGIVTARSGVNVSGGQLDVGSNIKLGNAGVITATSFVGNIVGGVTGNISIPESIVHTGDTNTRIAFIADETISFDTNGSEKLRITGAGSLITSNIGIGTDNRWKIRPNNSNQELTFEYSTSTSLADSNIKFRLGSAGQFGIGNAVNYGTSGQVLTSGGSGSAVSWSAIPTQVTIANNADNRVITGGSGVNLNGEANLTFDGNKLGVNRSGTLQYGISFAGAALDNNRIGWHDSSSKKAAIGLDDSDDSLNFYTGASTTERLRITSGGVVKIGGDVSNASSDVGTVTKLTIKQHTNTHEGGMYIERSGERRGFYMYVGGAGGLNDALCITTNQLGTDTNVLGIDRSNRLTKLGGDVVIDNSNNGYGGLRIVDSSAGEYSVNYIAGRNSGATAHVFSIGGRTQNSSPWANASQSECARISQRGMSFNGDDAQANALDDYEEGSYTPNVQTDNGVNCGMAVAQGYYVKVGKVVTVHLKIQTNSHNSVNTAAQYKVSLPYLSLAAGDTLGTLMCSIWSIGSSNISWMGGQVHNNNAWTHLAYHNGNNNNTNNLQPNVAGNQLQFRGTVVYRSNT